MAKKSLFSKSEWQLIADGPEWVFAALSAADGNAALGVKSKESKAFKNVVSDYSTRSSLVKEVIADKLKPAKEIKDASVSEANRALLKINALLSDKLIQSDADAYRGFLKDIAESVAEAVGEGLLGVGEKLSANEEKTLKKIDSALVSKPSKGTEAGTITFKKTKTATKPASKKPAMRRTPAAPRKVIDGAEKVSSKYIAKHTVESGESLSYIAKKYYDSGSRENWMKIYEENKELIGDNPNMIQPGQILKIPRL